MAGVRGDPTRHQSFAVDTAIKLSGESMLLQQRNAEIQDQARMIHLLSAELEQARRDLLQAERRIITADDTKTTQLVSAIQRAEAEIAAQIKARLDLETQLRVRTDELRSALKTASAREARVKEAEAAEQQTAQHAAALSQRLSALRLRNEQLERMLSETVEGLASSGGSGPTLRGRGRSSVQGSGARKAGGPSASPAYSRPRTALPAEDPRYASLKTELTTLQSSLRQAQRQLRKASDLGVRCQQAEQDRDRLHAQLVSLHATASDYESQLREMSHRLSLARDGQAQAEDSYRGLLVEHEACETQLAAARRTADVAHKAVEQALHTASQRQSCDSCAALRQELIDSQSEVGRLSASLETARLRAEAAVEAQAVATPARVDAEAEVAAAKANAVAARYSAQCDELKRELQALHAKVESEVHKMAQEQGRAEELERQLIAANADVAARDGQLEAVQADMRTLRTQLAEYEGRVLALSSQATRESTTTLAAHARAEEAEARLGDQAKQLATAQLEAEHLRGQATAERARCEVLTAEVTALQEALRTEQGQVRELRGRIDSLVADAEAQRASLDRARAETEAALQREVDEVRSSLANAVEDARRAEARALDAQSEAAVLRRKADGLQQQLEEARAALASATTHASDLSSELGRTRQALADSRDTVHRLEVQLAAVEGGATNAAQLRTALEEARQEADHLRQETSQSQAELARSRAREAELSADVKGLNSALEAERANHGTTMREWDASVTSIMKEQAAIDEAMMKLATEKAELKADNARLRSDLAKAQAGAAMVTSPAGTHTAMVGRLVPASEGASTIASQDAGDEDGDGEDSFADSGPGFG